MNIKENIISKILKQIKKTELWNSKEEFNMSSKKNISYDSINGNLIIYIYNNKKNIPISYEALRYFEIITMIINKSNINHETNICWNKDSVDYIQLIINKENYKKLEELSKGAFN
ncbi:MAG: hypothetical protein J6584_03180 [Lactobacillus sp.]|uniref:hypothetical protein n=1 Tax=Bombilactobacillus bombi TaxID=1303590 RepID=UPI0035E6EC4A|nr:hypothetical protein [Lactobacillus sp.]